MTWFLAVLPFFLVRISVIGDCYWSPSGTQGHMCLVISFKSHHKSFCQLFVVILDIIILPHIGLSYYHTLLNFKELGAHKKIRGTQDFLKLNVVGETYI